MKLVLHRRGYRAELTDEERVAFLWALEVGRALLLGDPNLGVLARETAVGPDLLDELADQLFLAGRPDPSDLSPSTLPVADCLVQ